MKIETQKKLAYLEETKSLIKAKLIEKGVAVSDTDTFRSYASKIDEIKGGSGGATVWFVTFIGADGSELFSMPVLDGDDCKDPITHGDIGTPTKESTVSEVFTYDNGWSATADGAKDTSILKSVTEDKTVYAAFTSSTRYYTITYYDNDGTTVLKTESLAYGSTPSYIPEKKGYSFTEWVPSVTTVRGDVSYSAQWVSKTTFAGGSWEEIVEIANEGKAEEYFAIGDERNVTLTDGTSYKLYIIGFNHDDLADGSGKANMTIMAGKAYTDSTAHDTFTISSWSSTSCPWTKLASDLNTVIKPKLPSDLKSGIKTVNKVCVSGTGSAGNTETKTVPFDLFPLSVEEMDIRRFYKRAYKGDEWYTYLIKAGESYPYFKSLPDTNASLYVNFSNKFWLRQGARYSNSNYYIFETGGTTSSGFYDINTSGGSTAREIRYAFCI